MLNDWQIQVRMLDYGKNTAEEDKVLEELTNELDGRFGYAGASFTYNGCGGIISDIFEAKIQSNLDEYWEDFFGTQHSYLVTAINTELETPLTWDIDGDTEFEYMPFFIDAWGNRCEIDTTTIIVYGNENSREDIYALPVKKMLETGEGWDNGGRIYKVPEFFEKHYEEDELETDEFSEFLRSTAGGTYGENGGYLLDKDGNKITAIKDFDHSEPDEDGNIYYPVPKSDLVDGFDCEMLTPEACEKWRAKLGL